MEKAKNFFFNNTSNKQTATKNTFWLLISEASSRLLKMILVIYAARVLGVDGWGIFSYALSIGSLLMIFADIGISGLMTREIIQKKENYKTFISSALFLKIIILSISTLFVIFIGPSISNIPEAKILFPIIAFVLFFDSMRDLGFAINRAFEKMEWEIVVKIIMGITITILGIILLKIKPVPKSITIAYAIGGAIGFFVIFIIIKKEIKKLLSKINKKSCNLVLKTTLPFAVIALIETIMSNTDIFMLGIWKNSTEIGLYSSAQKIQQFIIMVPSMFATATFPLISRLINDKEKFRDIFEKIMSFIMVICIPITIGGAILSSQIINLIFGSEYLGAISILYIFMFMLLVSFPLIFISNAIFAYNRQKDLIWAYLSGIIINVLLNLLLIPKFGAFGSAIATFASTTIIVIIIWKKMKKINNFEVLVKLKKSILSTFFMVLSIIILKYIGINVILNIIISSLVYLGSLIILKESILKELKSFYKN